MTDDAASSPPEPPDYFGESVAAAYDTELRGDHGAAGTRAAVDFLADLAEGGPALELAIGTGRIGIPLAERHIEVHGIELSLAMIRRLRAKPGGHEIAVTVGDMATTQIGTEFRLAYLVYNTISNLTTQDAQVACFANAAAHLKPGGKFVVEVTVPDLRRLPPGQDAVPFDVSPQHLGVDTYDPATQAMTSHHLDLTGDAPRYSSIPFRYVWPSELDLMARLAGMTLVERWDWWDRTPFTSDSRRHVSVWRRAD